MDGYVYIQANIEKRFSFFSARRFCCINVDIFVTMYVGRRVYGCLSVLAIVLGSKERRSSLFLFLPSSSPPTTFVYQHDN